MPVAGGQGAAAESRGDVTDQHTTHGTKVIVATGREAHYVLDEILGDAMDLPITEHATDTHGATLVDFALFDCSACSSRPDPGSGQDTLINFFGAIEVDIDVELAQLGPTGDRPLRGRDTLF